jgi:hypothetical protein
MKNAVFWDVTSCGSCNNPRFEEQYRFLHQSEKGQRASKYVSSMKQLKRILLSVLQFLVTDNVVPTSLIVVALMMEAIRSSESRFLYESHSFTSQKTTFFIVTAVKTSNLTQH